MTTEALRTFAIEEIKSKNMKGQKRDIDYWLSRPPIERIAAVTALVHAKLKDGERMDRTKVRTRKMRKSSNRSKGTF